MQALKKKPTLSQAIRLVAVETKPAASAPAAVFDRTDEADALVDLLAAIEAGVAAAGAAVADPSDAERITALNKSRDRMEQAIDRARQVTNLPR